MIDLAKARLTIENAQAAADEWGFNCGPAAVCAILGMAPDELRPHLLDFETKGYTNPTLMANILRGLGVSFRRKFESAGEPMSGEVQWPARGLVRIQWGGPWTKPGVPMRARYRATHWIGYRSGPGINHDRVFDVNALCVGGWLPFAEWSNQLVPWLLKECQPKADGRWWPTHCWEVTP